MNVYENMKKLGIELPKPPAKGGVYAPTKKFCGSLYYVSGCGPVLDEPIKGRVGTDYTLEEGQQFARNCILNVLAVLEAEIGDLNRVKSVVKVLAFVNSSNDFYDQPKVANGGSQLLVDIFGEEVGLASRSAIGVNVLPGNIPVEIEAIFEVE